MRYDYAHTLVCLRRQPGTKTLVRTNEQFKGPDGNPLHFKDRMQAIDEARTLSKENPSFFIAVASIEEAFHQGGCDAVAGADSPDLELSEPAEKPEND